MSRSSEAVKRRQQQPPFRRSSSSATRTTKAKKNSGSTSIYAKFALPILACLVALSLYAFRAQFLGLHDPLQKSDLPKALVDDLYNQTNWGTLRPQLYFGLKTKHPESPLFGLLWYKQPREEIVEDLPIRHWCDNGDKIKFSWIAHDGRTFGREQLEDDGLKMQIDWMANGRKSWNVRLNAEESSTNHSFALVFYMASQDQTTQLVPRNELSVDEKKKSPEDHYAFLEGYSHQLGHFSLDARLSNGISRNVISHTAYKIPPVMDMRHVNELMKASMGRREDMGLDLVLVKNQRLPGPDNSGANFAAVQFTFSGKFSIDLELLSDEDERLENFDSAFGQKLEDFGRKFDEIFPIDYGNASFREMGKTTLSNLLGGIGVWHGNSLAREAGSDLVRPYGPLSLISAVPSRPFFPRGFLWDEGFHNLIIRHYDPQLTLQIFASWLDSLSIDGWIPREMVLGSEAEAKVPDEYLVQSPSVANPPMFMFVLEKFLKNSEMFSRNSVRLARLYPRLKQFYIWLRTTQKGPRAGTMQWQGRNGTIQTELNPKTLPSGLDDFPRASHPSPQEYHLDLRCWMALSSKVLRQLAETFGDSQWVPTVEEDVRLFNNIDELDKLHWSEAAQQYSDFGKHSEHVQLVQEIVKKKVGQKVVQERVFMRKTIDEPQLRLVDNVYGYANLFPLLLRILPPDSAKLGIMLRSLNRTELLWTQYGLRSISTKSPYYLARNTEHDAPYWRGPIWININYLALDALRHYAEQGGPFAKLSAELYSQLRHNVVSNVAEQYARTGFLWENYNDRTGEGMGTRPFTGWTALVLNIMSEKFD